MGASGIGLIGPIGAQGRFAIPLVRPISPMSPMPWLLSRGGVYERVGGGGPLAGRILSSEYEPTRPSTGETSKERCNVLASSSLRINDEFYFIRKFIGFYGGGAVMLPPRSKQLNDPLSAGVVDLERKMLRAGLV